MKKKTRAEGGYTHDLACPCREIIDLSSLQSREGALTRRGGGEGLGDTRALMVVDPLSASRHIHMKKKKTKKNRTSFVFSTNCSSFRHLASYTAARKSAAVVNSKRHQQLLCTGTHIPCSCSSTTTKHLQKTSTKKYRIVRLPQLFFSVHQKTKRNFLPSSTTNRGQKTPRRSIKY